MRTTVLDDEGDSTMQSTPDDDRDDLFPNANAPTTPKVASSELSPPTSHGRGLFSDSAVPTATPTQIQASGASSALNENGKRTLAIGASSKGVQTHAQSGYRWERDEDAPGYAWKNKRAQEDAHRSWDNVLEKDKMIGNRYGDVLAPSNAGSAAA